MPTSPQEELELQAALAEKAALLDRYFAITPPQLGANEARLWQTWFSMSALRVRTAYIKVNYG